MHADLGALRNRQLAAQMRFAALQGRAAELLSQKTKLTEAISLAKARIELAPQVTELFNYLQERAHARSVGEFEDLLSAFVSDVVPEAGKIRLELGTERGAPALDILLDNNGNTEDILEGNGGGLTNVVVTALTYAAQSRAGIRPLVVLDEPDCWLKSTRVPDFTRVIAEVANPQEDADGKIVGGCQTLMISHNDITLIDEGAHILELKPGVDGPMAVSMSGSKAWADDSQVGIRWIEVENLRAHKKTRVYLCPGLNVLAGNINLGKSTLFITALRAIAYGDTNDTMIRHGSEDDEVKFMAVRVAIENNVMLEVVRNKKGSPKVVFRRYEDGKLVNESRQESRAGVPEFISQVLQIVRVDDLDIQLRSQKEPVFLLNEPAAVRARLLSVGKESGLLQNMIEAHRLELRRDRDSLKRDEVELAAVNRTLTVLGPLSGMATIRDLLTGLLDEIVVADKNAQDLTRLTKQLESLLHFEEVVPMALSELKDVPVVSIESTDSLARLIGTLESKQSVASLPNLLDAPEQVQPNDTSALAKLISVLVSTANAENMLDLLDTAPESPVVPNNDQLKMAVNRLEELAAGGQALTEQVKQAQTEEDRVAKELHNMMDALGVCPLCNNEFKKEEAHA